MALVPCPDCKNKISNMAEACPHCGFPIREVKRLRREKKAAERRKEAEKRRKMAAHDRKRVELRGLLTKGMAFGEPDDDEDLRQRTVKHAERVSGDMKKLRKMHRRHWKLKIALTRADDPTLRVDDPKLEKKLWQLQSSLEDWRRRLGIWCEQLPNKLACFGVIAVELAGRRGLLYEWDCDDISEFSDFCEVVLLDHWSDVKDRHYHGTGLDFWALELDEDWSSSSFGTYNCGTRWSF